MLPFTLQQLRILKAVAAEKSFTKAAEILYLSQPSLSKQIKTLEKRLDILLINRENNKISLTKNGKILLHYSERILALCEESCRALIDSENGERGNLTIAASQTIGIYLIPRLLTLFAKNHPQVNLKVQVSSTEHILKNILKNNVDVAIIEKKKLSNFKKNLFIQHFAIQKFYLIISKSHSFAKKEKIAKKKLYSLGYIILNSDCNFHNFINNVLIQNKVQPRELKIVLKLKSIRSIQTAVGLGLGSAFISSSIIKNKVLFETVHILKINEITTTKPLSIIHNSQFSNSKFFMFLWKGMFLEKK